MKDWTIMVYMAGDNNLNDDMFAGILGLRERIGAPLKDKVSFLIYFDGETISAKTLQIDFSDSQAGFVTLNSENSSSNISEFVKWCVNDREQLATNYALIFSGHGDNFLSGKFLRDDNSAGYLTGQGLRKELREVKKILDDKKLKVMGFDSCVMNSVETAYEMSPFAEILIGSQGYFPNAGWDYGRIATNLSKEYAGNQTVSSERMATIITNSLIEANYRYALYAGRSIDICWTDLSQIDSVASATYDFAAKLTNIHDQQKFKVELEQALLVAHWKCQTYYYDQCIDLIDFCEILLENCGDDLKKEIETECKALIDAAGSCVKRSLFLGPEFQFARGFSLFFPWSYDTYKKFFEKIYRNLDMATGSAHIGDERTFDKSKWTAFLDKYLLETKRPINKRAGEAVQDLKGLSVDASRSGRTSPLTSFFTPFEKKAPDFTFDAHRVGGGDRPRVGGGDRPRVGGGDRPKGGAVPEEVRITKNYPWVWNEWGLSPEVKKILLEAGIIDGSGKPAGFIPA